MKKSNLSQTHQIILETMSAIGHGRIENLLVTNGRITTSAETKIVRTIILDRKSPISDQSRSDGDFLLNERHRAFFENISKVNHGKITSIMIADGLPVRIELTSDFQLDQAIGG